MGVLIKIILFVIVFFWILKGVSRFFLARFVKQAQQKQQFQGGQQRQNRPTDGNVHIDYAPKKPKKKSSDQFKGGDYVDYEEVD